MARKPYTWSRKPTRARRTYRAVADSARERARIARDRVIRRAAMKLKGHKYSCPCGKTFRTKTGRDACALRHARETRARTKGTPRAKTAAQGKDARPGHHSCAGCGKTFRNDLQLNDHARQHAEREERAERRKQERGRRTDAATAREKRGGRPAGAPKTRTGRTRPSQTRAERAAEWHAHRMQHAAGRVTRDGQRIPNAPKSPRVVQPKTRVAPNVR